MDFGEKLRQRVEQFVEGHPGNRERDGSRYFDAPLVGFASATDPLFQSYKEIIGTFHRTPLEVLHRLAGAEGAVEGTVVSWILPIAEPVRLSNRREDRYPSRQWGRTRTFGEKFNDELRKFVAGLLQDLGGRAVAPMLAEEWSQVDDPEVGLASTWSERHAAYAAGLGTFSINDGLITPKGIAHRCGSVVTGIVIEPTARPYKDYRENCLLCKGEPCGVCIVRCPVGAISEDGHDKDMCRRYTYSDYFRALARDYGAVTIGCGLCQTDVPCEFRIP